MSIVSLTCIECPIGCSIEVEMQDGKVVSVKGNACPRGKLYAENEVVCPKRVITSTVRAKDGSLVPVKTDKPVKKSEIFSVMEKINAVVCDMPVTMGQVLVENIEGDANLVVSGV